MARLWWLAAALCRTQSEGTQVAVWGLQQGVIGHLQHHHKPWRDANSPSILQRGVLLVGGCLPGLAQACSPSGFKRADLVGTTAWAVSCCLQ